MELMPWVYFGISLFLIYVLLEAWSLNRGGRRPSDFYQENFYFILFLMSVLWLLAGILMRDYVLTGVGILFVAGSLLNRGEWENHDIGWGRLNEEEKKIIRIMTYVLAATALSGLLVFYLVSKGMI